MRGIDIGIEMMEVSQDGKNWVNRYGVRYFVGESCIAVHTNDEDVFLDEREFKVFRWKYWREIKKGMYRRFEINEMPSSFFHRTFRTRKEKVDLTPVSFRLNNTDRQIRFDGDWVSHDDLLKSYEIRVGTKWIPVGVDVSVND